MAITHCNSVAKMQREKVRNKLLIKAAIDLAKSNFPRGPLAIAAAVYAKKLTEADSATVFDLHGRRQFVRFWELGRKGGDGRGKKDGEARIIERDNVPVPRNLQRVVAGAKPPLCSASQRKTEP